MDQSNFQSTSEPTSVGLELVNIKYSPAGSDQSATGNLAQEPLQKTQQPRDKFGPGVTRTPELRVRSRIEYNLCFGDREEAIRDMVAAERAKNATGP